MNEYLADLAVEDVELYLEGAQDYVTGRRLLPILKKMIAFETLLARFNKKPHEAAMLRAFVDEPGLDRDLLKDQTALTDAVANVKKTLRIVYPKLEPSSRSCPTKSINRTRWCAACRPAASPSDWM